MSMCVKEAYASFKEENPGIKLGVSKFTSLHAKHILFSSQMPSNVCTCVYHENFVMALSAVASVLSYYKDLAASCLVNPEQDFCWFGECDHENTCGFDVKYTLPDEDVEKNAKWMKREDQKDWLTRNPAKARSGRPYSPINLILTLSPPQVQSCSTYLRGRRGQ